MDFKEFTAGKDDDGRRLDRILRIFLNDIALGEIYKLLRKGLIKVNHKKAKPDSHVSEGDVISIADFLIISDNNHSDTKDKTDSIQPLDQNLIVYENEHLLIIDKPYGVSVHGSDGSKDGGLDRQVALYFELKYPEKKASSLSFKPGPLHRLDRNTTGLLVFSMSLEGAQWFTNGIKNHTVQKKYYGLSQGNLNKVEEWEDKLNDSEVTESGFYTVSQSATGQLAQTTARPLAHGNLDGKPVTLVEFSIKTGRKHQIRAQSSIHGYPLAGDKAYGASKVTCRAFTREYYLQAFSLKFPKDNPLKLPDEVKISPSGDFMKILEYCEIKNPGL